MDIFLMVLEIIGTVAFAVSGAMTGIKKKMDILGVLILGLATAVGGGIIRDIILGITPPTALKDPLFSLISITTSAIIFVPAVRKWLTPKYLFEKVLFYMDTLGLGIFTVMGVGIAFDSSADHSGFLIVFVGVLTGVGGGVLRDMLAGNTPYIFTKHIYACACVAGALICYILLDSPGRIYAIPAGIAFIIIIRVISSRFKLNLPRAKDLC